MSDSITNNSDDEVCTGDLTLEEIKIHINKLRRRETIAYVKKTQEDCNESLKIIEVHSSPDIVSVCNPPSPAITKAESDPNVPEDVKLPTMDYQDSDESFLELEKMIAKLCGSSESLKNELNNEPETIGKYDLNGEAIHDALKSTEINSNELVDLKHSEIRVHIATPQLHKTPCSVFTPSSGVSLLTDINPKKPIFKTPAKISSHKKDMVTPLRKQYQHVVSPVGTYIRKCPTVSLMQNIRPKKPIPGTSSIPKLVKSIPKTNVNNIENFTLPQVAYRTAKETKLIEIPNEQKLPKSQWAKQVASSIPKAFVIKHSHQHGSAIKPLRNQEDSVSDLSLHQADVSVCTKTSAFDNQKNK